MSSIDKPIYLVAYLDNWLMATDAPHAALAFGTREDAEKAAIEAAREREALLTSFRIVEFVTTGNVSEA